MQLAATPALARLQNLQTEQENSFFILAADHSIVRGTNLRADISVPCAGIILLGQIGAEEFSAAFEFAADPAVPIADFGGNETLRRDFVGANFDQASLRQVEDAFAPIQQRLVELPFKAERECRAELTILRLAYSRNTPITALFDPKSRRLIEYPLLGAMAGEQRNLEILAHLDLLKRRHFTRTHVCAKCDSARLHVYEACPGCGGGDLREESLLHHYRCGCQEVESHFTQDQYLICPKCHRSLQHLGVDYGKPGVAVICATCGAANSEPAIHFACLDCGSVTQAETAKAIDWYHYDITDEGVRALRQGQLPQFDLAPLLESRTNTYSPREFRLLAMQELKVAKRFNRSFSVARISVLNLQALLRQHGPVATDAGFRRVVDAVVAGLRSSDFVGIGMMESAVIGFPDTSVKDVDVIMAKIRRTIDETLTSRVELSVQAAEGDAIIELLAGR